MRNRLFTVKEEVDKDGDYRLSNEYYIHGDDLELVEHEA
jgi:hypothetical protein